MHINYTPAPPPGLPCWRDLHELTHVVLCPKLITLTPLDELERRLHEVVAQHPRFREEAPLVLLGEARRRSHFNGLRVASSLSHVHVA